ncbi:MAG: NAD(P)H-binding protein [Candidatus Lokiarchaeota archaeon]|nr:NAD(P)H-binding protein [Candidatus Lokiarchaeota archaeon]
MSRIIVLGGCGAVGQHAVKTLVAIDEFSEVIIGDIDIEKAKKLKKEINHESLRVKKVDALDQEDIKKAINDCDLVLNCTGPFYKFVPIILKTVIETGINYVDICDDYDVTKKILDWDDKAKNANVSALIGMGSSPGVTNVLGKFCSDQLLDKVESIDIYHAHGGEPTEGPGVVYHRFHSMLLDIPMFLNGELQFVKYFEEDGKALQEEVEFYKLKGKHRVYPYPHPEQITIPRYIKDIKRVTNKGTVLPKEYYNLTRNIVKIGMVEEDPIIVPDINRNKAEIKPIDFAISYVINQRDKILEEVKFGEQRGCVKVVIKGIKKNKKHTYIFQMASEGGQSMGEGTGIPAAFGAILMNQGKIKQKGVFPPEGGVKPLDFIDQMQKFLKLGKVGDEKAGSPLIIDSIDEIGVSKRITF